MTSPGPPTSPPPSHSRHACAAWRRRARPRGPQAEVAQAPADPRPDRPRCARVRLHGLRHDDGGRLRPATAGEQGSVPQGGQFLPVRRSLAADRHLRAAEQRRDRLDHRRPQRDLPGDAGRHRRDRGQALLHQPRRRHPRHRTGVRRRHHRRGAPGRLDDRPAVRQERALRAEQPDDPREAPRGGPRLPPDAQVEQAARSSRST